MKNSIIYGAIMTGFLIVFSFACAPVAAAQGRKLNDNNFEERVIGYYPPLRDGVDEKDYRKGKSILENAYSQIGSDNRFVYADYWNIAVGFSYMHEDKENIEIAFNKAVQSDWKSVCEVIKAFGGKSASQENGLSKAIPGSYAKLNSRCRNENSASEPQAAPEEYARENNLDPELVKMIAKIGDDDQLVRKEAGLYYDDPDKLAKQNALDKANREIVEALFKKYKKYVGSSMVGRKYESIMWLVIQHSNLEMMEKYLPVIHQAVKDGDLHVTPLKMLIDRIYSIKYKYQIFGSQGGVSIADEETIEKVKRQYGIE
ncbi:MAG: hypothetical protein KDB79_02155 [Acidobacteria bacterium]|nr:hypothetical protein [Acidobacteriota bacterium]